VSITVDKDADVPGLQIRRDGESVGRGQWGSPLPADAGNHVIIASATGRTPWETTLKMADGESKSIKIPVLAIDPTASAQARAVAALGPSDEIGRGRRTAGIATGIVGLVALATGGTFGILAMSKAGQSSGHCYPGNYCDAIGVSERNDAITFANVSTVALAAGAGVVLAGFIIYMTAPSAPPRVQGTMNGLVWRF
jgi:hypothetical protein